MPPNNLFYVNFITLVCFLFPTPSSTPVPNPHPLSPVVRFPCFLVVVGGGGGVGVVVVVVALLLHCPCAHRG